MKDIIFDDFQNSVNNSLLRHKSILDILSKYGESNARVNRAITKAVTNCGCIKINACKQCIPKENDSLENLADCFKSHMEGHLCDNCREVIENEIVPVTLDKSLVCYKFTILVDDDRTCRHFILHYN